MRTKRSDLYAIIARLQRQGVDITISWAYGQPRCYTRDEARELSPRLPMGQMLIWLEAYEKGHNTARGTVTRAAVKLLEAHAGSPSDCGMEQSTWAEAIEAAA